MPDSQDGFALNLVVEQLRYRYPERDVICTPSLTFGVIHSQLKRYERGKCPSRLVDKWPFAHDGIAHIVRMNSEKRAGKFHYLIKNKFLTL